MRTITILIGNGVTIDLMQHLGLLSEINATNLFSCGDEVEWPNSNGFSGFLTYNNCPNLISLGITPETPAVEAAIIFEKIITCANFYSYRSRGQGEEEKNIYIRAYLELVEYLRALFICYDKRFTNSDWKNTIETWPWYQGIKALKKKYEKINIITLNYDIYLERALQHLGEEFQISQIEKEQGKKITIFKPHGSISFVSSVEQGATSNTPDYYISYKFKDPLTPSDITTSYDHLEHKRLINTIIPPYGDSARYQQSWSRLIIESALSGTKSSDTLLISGISYWHVDRLEVDKILLSANDDCNVIKINPRPNPIFDAVLQSRFPKYQHYRNSSILSEITK